MACVGEPAYAEKNGDLKQLDLPSGIAAFVKDLKKVSDGTTPIVLALVEGRPRLLGDLPGMVRVTLKLRARFSLLGSAANTVSNRTSS